VRETGPLPCCFNQSQDLCARYTGSQRTGERVSEVLFSNVLNLGENQESAKRN
jgi:hypothetical protein